jgi:hypothetical protein
MTRKALGDAEPVSLTIDAANMFTGTEGESKKTCQKTIPALNPKSKVLPAR